MEKTTTTTTKQKKKKTQKMLDPGIPLCCQFHLSENFYNINSFLCEYTPPITCLT